MSVTFNLLLPHPIHGEIHGEICDCADILRSQGHGEECEDFGIYLVCDHSEDMCKHNLLAVNVSNVNARDLLASMGFVSPDLVGSAEGDVFVRRAMRLANGKDMATQTITTGGCGTGQAMMVEVGRREGYANDRGIALMRLGQEAVARGLRIGWA